MLFWQGALPLFIIVLCTVGEPDRPTTQSSFEGPCSAHSHNQTKTWWPSSNSSWMPRRSLNLLPLGDCFLCRKIPAPIKIKSALPPPPKTQNPPPPPQKMRNFMDMEVFQQKEGIFSRCPSNWRSHFRPQNCGQEFHGHEDFSDLYTTSAGRCCHQNRQNRHGCLLVLYFVGEAKGGQGAFQTVKTVMKATPLKLNPLFRHPDKSTPQSILRYIRRRKAHIIY